MADGRNSGLSKGTNGSPQISLENFELKVTSTSNEQRMAGKEKNVNKLIIPFLGYCEFKLYQSIDDAIEIIKSKYMNYTTELWANSKCSNPVPWTIIRVDNQIHLFFAKSKLFKIYLNNGCEGFLPNGISIGMPMGKALEIDKELLYNGWNKNFQSPLGYWIEDSLDDNTVLSISIFIKEVLDEVVFNRYEW